MRIAIAQDELSSEEGGQTPELQGHGQREEKTASHVREMNTTSKARLQAIKDRVASHTPYTANRSRRRGMDGVQDGAARQKARNEDHALVVPEVFHSPAGSSFASKLLSVATTPLRAAWGMVTSQLRTPSASPLGLDVGGGPVGVDPPAAADGPDHVNDHDSVLAKADYGASPSLRKPPARASEGSDGEGLSPSRKATTGRSAGASPKGRAGSGARSPSPMKEEPKGVQTPFDDVRSALRGGPIVRASPQLYPPPSRSTIKGMPQSMQVPRSAQPAFTFGATKQRLLASVPAKLAPSANLALPGGLGDEGTPAQTRKKMVFGSQRGSAMKEVKEMPLAWTPLRATPLSRPAAGVRTRFVPTSSRFAPALQASGGAAPGAGAMASRKRRADDVNGMNPSMDDGSVSLLDMQRRRRFKPSEDPGSVQRRSWRAGRTPYSHMARYRRRIDEEDSGTQDTSLANAGATPAAMGRVSAPSPSPKATTDTARRILDTLDSMEEKIRKSKERISPVDARMYTLDATAPPPPGASLGGLLSTPMNGAATPPSVATTRTPLGMGMTTAAATEMPKATFGTTPLAKVNTKSFLAVQEATPAPISNDAAMGAGSWKAAEATRQMFGTSPSSASDRPSGGKKKRTRTVGDAKSDGDDTNDQVAKKAITVPPTAENPAFTPVLFTAAPALVADVATTAPVAPLPTVSEPSGFVFGKRASLAKEEAAKSIDGIKPSMDSTKFSFGKDKPAAPHPARETTAGESGKSDEGNMGAPVAFTFGSAVEKAGGATAADGPEPAPKPAFTFGASAPAPAAPIFGAPPGEKKDVAVEEKAAAPTGWGADFLKNNAAAASVATAAVEKEVNSEAGGASAPTPAPTFKFGAPAADLGVPDAAASAGASEPLSKPAFQFGAAAAPSAAPAAPFSASFSFGASAGSEKAPAAPFTGKAPTLDDPNATVPAADEAPAFKFGTSTPSPPTFTSEVTEAKAAADGPEPAPKPAFTFGASAPAPAAPIFGAPPGEKKDVAVEEKAAAPTGWGADFLKNNAAAASVATAAVEKEVNSEAGGASAPTPAPTFKFGAPAADLGVPDAAASAGASEPLSKPAFQFGAAAAPSDAVAGPVDQGNEVIAPSVTAAPAATGFVFGVSSTVPKESAGGFGASFGSGAFGTTVAAPVASSAAAFGSASSAPAFAFGTGKKSGAAGFAFGSQTAAVSAFGAPLGSSAPSSFGSSVGGFGATTPASTATPIVMTPPASNAFGAPTGGFGAPSAAPTSSSFGAPAAGFGAPSASGSGGFGGFGSSAAGGFGSTAPFGGASSTAAFGAPASQGNTNVFGQPAAGQFGAPENGGFQSQPFGAPSAFPPTSAPGQMIPNNPDNPFGGGNAGGFNVGSTGTGGTQSRSEGRRKVRVKRRH